LVLCSDKAEDRVPTKGERTESRERGADQSVDLIEEAWAYWNRIRGTRRMPSRTDFDPIDIPRLLSSTALVEVLRDPLDFRFRLLGTAIDSITERNVRGLRFSEISFLLPGNKGWVDYEYVATTGLPLKTDRAYVGRSRLVLKLTDSLFPLTSDG